MTSAGASSANEAIIDMASPRHWNAVRSPVRLGLLEVITSTGGATARELSELLGLKSSLVHYHLGILERSGLISASARDGRSGRVFMTAGRRLVVAYDKGSRTQSERIRQLVITRLDHSVKVIESHAGVDHGRLMVHWESLTREEHREVVKHFDQVDRILSRARRRRRRQGLDAQRATSHVVFAVESTERAMPPSPRLEIRPRS